MNEVNFKKGLEANLPVEAGDETFLLTTDSNKLFVGKGAGKPIAPLSTGVSKALGSLLLNNTVNMIYDHFRTAELRNVGKYNLRSLVVDPFKDATGIDATLSSTTFKVVNGEITTDTMVNASFEDPAGSTSIPAGTKNNTSVPGWWVDNTRGGNSGVSTAVGTGNGTKSFYMRADGGGNVSAKASIYQQFVAGDSITFYMALESPNSSMVAELLDETGVKVTEKLPTGAAWTQYSIPTTRGRTYTIRFTGGTNQQAYGFGAYVDNVQVVNPYNPSLTIVANTESVPISPTRIVVVVECTGTAPTVDVSLDGGESWILNVGVETLVDVSAKQGTNIKIRLNSPAGTVIKALGYAWFDESVTL